MEWENGSVIVESSSKKRWKDYSPIGLMSSCRIERAMMNWNKFGETGNPLPGRVLLWSKIGEPALGFYLGGDVWAIGNDHHRYNRATMSVQYDYWAQIERPELETVKKNATIRMDNDDDKVFINWGSEQWMIASKKAGRVEFGEGNVDKLRRIVTDDVEDLIEESKIRFTGVAGDANSCWKELYGDPFDEKAVLRSAETEDGWKVAIYHDGRMLIVKPPDFNFEIRELR